MNSISNDELFLTGHWLVDRLESAVGARQSLLNCARMREYPDGNAWAIDYVLGEWEARGLIVTVVTNSDSGDGVYFDYLIRVLAEPEDLRQTILTGPIYPFHQDDVLRLPSGMQLMETPADH